LLLAGDWPYAASAMGKVPGLGWAQVQPLSPSPGAAPQPKPRYSPSAPAVPTELLCPQVRVALQTFAEATSPASLHREKRLEGVNCVSYSTE